MEGTSMAKKITIEDLKKVRFGAVKKGGIFYVNFAEVLPYKREKIDNKSYRDVRDGMIHFCITVNKLVWVKKGRK